MGRSTQAGGTLKNSIEGMSQLLPFFDDTAISLCGEFETEVYRAL